MMDQFSRVPDSDPLGSDNFGPSGFVLICYGYELIMQNITVTYELMMQSINGTYFYFHPLSTSRVYLPF